MNRSSKRWISEQNRDPYIKKARQEHFRSRAAYKLIQIQEKYQVIRPGDRILDLGASPGGWSQVASGIAGKGGGVLAVDLLAMEPLSGVRFLQGDFTKDETLQKLHLELEERSVDLVVSDMAPNTSGVSSLDHDRSILLVTSVFEFLPQFLKPGGDLVVKVFQGRAFKDLMDHAQPLFRKGKIFKPKASRARSVEVYWVGIGYRGNG